MSARVIRVLIVDDVPESRDNVEKLLRFESDVEVIGKAARGQEGIDLALRLLPDVILMDINMPDMDGITATTEITSRLPSVGVIMMSVQDEPDMLRRAMLAGAREFLAKPFSLEELITAVRHVSRLAQQAQRPVMTTSANGTAPRQSDGGQAKVIAVVGNKGGVGRSAIATNVAMAIRTLTSKQVALIDASLSFGDIGVMMNVAKSKTFSDIAIQPHQLDREILEDIMVTHSSGIRLLLAPSTPQESETVSAEHLRAAVTVLSKSVEYIVIDTRPGFDDTMLALMDESDVLLLVLTMEMTTIKDTRQFLEIAELLGYPDDKITLVLNRFNNYSGIPVADIAENLKREIEFKVPDEPAAMLRSVNEGSPLVSSQPENRFSAEIIRLTTSLVQEHLEESDIVAKNGHRSGSLVFKLRSALGHG
ncbi:MAG TPA: response regulator [Nitrolancea sp.]|nr:response regulator [Nitrolancea sp.]